MGMISLLLGLMAILVFAILAIFIFSVVVNWKLFEKAGKPGWAALIPVYNMVISLEIAGYKWYYIFLMFLGFVPIVGSIIVLLFDISANIKLAASFDQPVGFGIGLCLLNPVFVALIAFNKDIKYVGPVVEGDIDFNNLF